MTPTINTTDTLKARHDERKPKWYDGTGNNDAKWQNS